MTEIRFPATVYKCQTLIDQGIRITLDLPEDCIPQMAMLAETKRQGIPLIFTVKPEENGLDGKQSGRRRKSHDDA